MPPEEEQTEPPKPRQRLVQVRKKAAASEPKTEPGSATQANDEPEDDDRAPELHTPFASVPPEENDPTQRNAPTVGLIELTPEGREHFRKPERPLDIPGADFEVKDVSDGQHRTLDDIMAAFPIGNGQYYVRVTRQAPASFNGSSTRGILKTLRDAIPIEEFIARYGGGVYDLIVYGPPKRGGIPDEHTGTIRPKALTKPIRMTIPWHHDGGHPPNPDSAYEEDDEENDMTMRETSNGRDRLPFGMNSRGVTPAAANLAKHAFEHDETMDDRDRREKREDRQERRRDEQTALQIVSEQAARREQELLETVKQLTARLDRQEQRKPQSDLEGMAKVLSTVNPRTSAEELQTIREGHQRELDRITQSHRAEVDSLTRRHSEDRSRMETQHRADIDRAEQRSVEVSRRSDERVAEIERRIEREREQAKADLDRQKRDLDGSHEREITFARNESTRALEAQKQSYESILASERRSAEREIEVKMQIAKSELATEKSRYEIENRALKNEATRREKDVEEFKRKAEENKDLGKALEQVRRTAELVGYVPKEENAGGETEEFDWKKMAFHAITEGAKNLPQILQSAGQAVAQVRGQQPQQSPQQRQLPPPGYGPAPMGLPAPQGYPAQRPRAFATEASGIEAVGGPSEFQNPNQGISPSPMMQQQPMVRQEPPPPHMQVAYAPPMVAPDQRQAPPPASALPAPGVAPAPGSAPSVAPPPQAPSTPPPAGQPAAPPGAYDAIILQAREQVLEPAFKDKQPANAVAAFIVQQLGPERVRAFLPTFEPDAIIGAIRRAGVSSGLVTRAGRKYLVQVQSEVMKAVGLEGKA